MDDFDDFNLDDIDETGAINTPYDDDYVISDCGYLGSQYYVTQLDRRFSDWDDMLAAIRADMDRQQFYGAVWYVNDHGNIESVRI